MLGGGPYEASICPECGSIMWNGRCENTDCDCHYVPLDTDSSRPGEDISQQDDAVS